MGSLSNIFNASNITFNIDVSGFILLLSILGFATFSLLITSLLTVNSIKRNELYVISGICCGIFMFILIFGSIPNISNESVDIKNAKSKLTISELNYLSDQAIAKNNYDRALMHLNSIRQRLSISDSRLSVIDSKIEHVKKSQF